MEDQPNLPTPRPADHSVAVPPVPPVPPTPVGPVPADWNPAWYVKTPGTRPDQDTIVIAADHIINRQGKDFVLYSGLLNAAHKAGLQSISTSLVQAPSEHNGGTVIVHATAEFPWGSFSGLGDADNGNVSRNIQPHKIRMAETRAKARCLRDALNIGMVAIEEMGPNPDEPARDVQQNRQAIAQPSFTPSGAGFGGVQRTDTSGAPRSGAAPRPVQRPDGTSNVTSSPGVRKSYGTPLTRGPVE